MEATLLTTESVSLKVISTQESLNQSFSVELIKSQVSAE